MQHVRAKSSIDKDTSYYKEVDTFADASNFCPGNGSTLSQSVRPDTLHTEAGPKNAQPLTFH